MGELLIGFFMTVGAVCALTLMCVAFMAVVMVWILFVVRMLEAFEDWLHGG